MRAAITVAKYNGDVRPHPATLGPIRRRVIHNVIGQMLTELVEIYEKQMFEQYWICWAPAGKNRLLNSWDVHHLQGEHNSLYQTL